MMNPFTIKVHTLSDLDNLSKDVLIVSSVKHSKKLSFMKDLRRMYTAFNHARLKLVIVGSVQQLLEVEPIDQFVAYVR